MEQLDSTGASAGHPQIASLHAIRVLTVDDHAVVRQGIRGIIQHQYPRAVVREAATAQEALDAVWSGEWDLILLDVSLPSRCGIDLLKEIKAVRARTPVLIFTMHAEEHFAIRALRAGASGHLTKDTTPEVLLQAIRRLLSGGKFITPTLAEQLATHIDAGITKLPHESLSDREFEILRLIGAGQTVGAIATQLCLSVKTISTYRVRLLVKMGLKNNSELMNYALRHGLVE